MLRSLITIALLSYSINLSASNDSNFLTGELQELNDSVTISYNDLRIANSKMVELEFQKEMNEKLLQIIANDNKIITNYAELNSKLNSQCKEYIKQRNIVIGVGSGIIAALITGLIIVAK